MTSDLDEKTKSLNQSGAFLQLHVINQLEKCGWNVLSEYPVRISPFIDSPENDDTIKQGLENDAGVEPNSFVRTVRNCMDKTTVKETSIDVIAAKYAHRRQMHTLCIESKKLHPDFVDWVFFKQTQSDGKLRLLVKSECEPEVPLFTTPKTTKYEKTHLEICTIKEFSGYEICDFGISLKNKKIDNEYYKSDKTKVDDATRQIMEGTYGYIVDKILQNIQQGEPDLQNNDIECFFPIVVTNANLFVCDVDKNKIDPQKGTINENPEYMPVDSLIYECPTPSTIQFPEPFKAILDSDKNRAIKKWHVLVLSPKGFAEFLDILDKSHISKITKNPF